MRHRLLSVALTALMAGLPATSAVRAQTDPLTKVPGGYLDVRGSRIHYEECGTGPTIILLHDGLIDSSTWDNVWKPLCASFHVVRYDRRGFGFSDAPQRPFSPSDDLLALLQHVNVSRATIVGNSSGGALAIDFALEHPAIVTGLFLIGPVVHGMQDSAYFTARGDKNNEPLKRNDVRSTAENWSQDRFLIGPDHDAARKQFFDALMRHPQSLSYPGNLELRPSPPAAGRLSQIQAPVFMMVGEYDIADVHAYCGAIQNGVPENARLVVKDSGHLIQLDNPDVVVDRLSRFAQRSGRAVVKVPSADLTSLAGTYKLGETPVTVSVRNGNLVVEVPNVPPVAFYAQSNSVFFARLREIDIEFKRDAAGRVTQMDLHQAGTVTTCPRA
jgi:3-oxoadipate enol-lactonase